jgi:hypothetical protein
MPLLTEADPPRKRCAPVWALILAVVVLVPVVVIGWSCFQPIFLVFGKRKVAFGRTTFPPAIESGYRRTTYFFQVTPGYGYWGVRLPGGPNIGWYGGTWAWPN